MKLKTIALLGVAAAAVMVYAQAQRTLTINSRIASTDVRMISGRAYAPIADIAKALNLTVKTKGTGYELVAAGGTNQLMGLSGKTGDWLFDGGWRFKVNRTYRTSTYRAKNDYYGDNDFEVPEGKEMIIVEYSYRNGNKELHHFCIGKTALAGVDGDSWEPYSNDFPFDGSRFFARGNLPGAQAEGALIFYVNPGFNPKDLVLTVGDLAGYDDSVKPKKPTVFRVKLELD